MKNKPEPRESYSVLLAHFLRELCDRTNTPQADLANELGRPVDFIDRIAEGTENLQFVEFIEIAKLVGLDPVEAVKEFRERMPNGELP